MIQVNERVSFIFNAHLCTYAGTHTHKFMPLTSTCMHTHKHMHAHMLICARAHTRLEFIAPRISPPPTNSPHPASQA